MNKILASILILFCFACKTPIKKVEKKELYKVRVGEKVDYYFENDIKVSSVFESCIWVYCRISYQSDNGEEYWQLPEETYDLKEGDCEDHAILFQYIVETKFDIRTYMIIVFNQESKGYHALSIVDNLFYDPTIGEIYYYLPIKYKLLLVIPYPKLMWMTYYYRKGVGWYY